MKKSINSINNSFRRRFVFGGIYNFRKCRRTDGFPKR